MAQYNRNNWHHIPGIGGTMATGLSTLWSKKFNYLKKTIIRRWFGYYIKQWKKLQTYSKNQK